MKYLITYQALIDGEITPREALVDSESKKNAIKLVLDDFFSSNIGGKVKLTATVEVIDAR